MIRCKLVVLLLLARSFVFSQELEAVGGLPTKEIYDLLIDKKGYLWIGHNLGISRYDGFDFIHYKNYRQSNLALTDLVEDNYGRIWCHNFAGQVFYLANHQLHLLEEYDFNNESQSPRLALFGDELVVTSAKGLFVYDTRTRKSKYEAGKYLGSHSGSLTVLNDKVVVFHEKILSWSVYEKGKGLRKMPADPRIEINPFYGHALQPKSFRDTVFFISNTIGNLQKLVVRGDSLLLAEQKPQHAFISTVQSSDTEYWVHTARESVSNRGEIIRGKMVSDAIKDSQGNTWFSSLKYGLFCQLKGKLWSRLRLPLKDSNDVIKAIATDGNFIIFGSQHGSLVYKNSKAGSWQVLDRYFPANNVIRLKHFRNDYYVVSASVGTYLFHPPSKQKFNLRELSSDISIFRDTITIAAISDVVTFKTSWNEKTNQLEKQLTQTAHMLFKRFSSLAYDTINGRLYGADNNALWQLGKGYMKQILLADQPINATTLAFSDQLYIGTVTQGVFQLNNGNFKKLPVKLASNSIIMLQAIGNHLWIFEDSGVEVYNIATKRLIKSLPIPHLQSASYFDVAEYNGEAYLATSEGIFHFPLNRSYTPKLNNYLDYVLVNGADTIFREASLPWNRNNLSFFISAPHLGERNVIKLYHRLLGSNNEDWQQASLSRGRINLNSLAPGDYVFEAYAVFNDFHKASTVIRFNFSIQPPFWQRWWFLTLIFLVIAAILYFVYSFYLKKQYQRKLVLEQERQRIASEIHDEIGAGLSGIKLLSELAASKAEIPDVKNYLLKINGSSRELAAKVKEVIWSLNNENDRLDNLVYYMVKQARSMFEYSPIELKTSIPSEIPPVNLDGNCRRNIFLAVKEALNNVLKHSDAGNCFLQIELIEKELHILVKDDGKGLKAYLADSGNGLRIMRNRVKELKGKMTVLNHPGLSVNFMIPIVK